MDENARLHRTIILNEDLKEEDITVLEWPAYSPDFDMKWKCSEDDLKQFIYSLGLF